MMQQPDLYAVEMRMIPVSMLLNSADSLLSQGTNLTESERSSMPSLQEETLNMVRLCSNPMHALPSNKPHVLNMLDREVPRYKLQHGKFFNAQAVRSNPRNT